MLKRKYMIAGLLTFCLTATLLIGVTSSAPYDPWCDIDDNGIIDIVDIVNLAIRFGEEGTPINKTELLLDLQDRIEALETGYVGAPAYDSGWVNINQDEIKTFAHNLGTEELFVYVIGNSSIWKINQAHIGGERDTYPDSSTDRWGLYWSFLNSTNITVHRNTDDLFFEQVRVMIWMIQSTP